MAFGLSSWRFLHDEYDEDDGQKSEDRSPSQGPVPIAVEGDGKSATDYVAKAAGNVNWIVFQFRK